MKKILTTVAIAGSLAFMGASAAQATPSTYPAPPVVTVIDVQIVPGQSVTISGFRPFSTVTVRITRGGTPTSVTAGAGSRAVGGPVVLSTVISNETYTADANGNIEVPINEPGTYTVTATGIDAQGNPVTVSDTVVVAAASTVNNTTGNGTTTAANTSGLANTGVDGGMLLWGAAGVLALGAGVTTVVVSRRKNA